MNKIFFKHALVEMILRKHFLLSLILLVSVAILPTSGCAGKAGSILPLNVSTPASQSRVKSPESRPESYPPTDKRVALSQPSPEKSSPAAPAGDRDENADIPIKLGILIDVSKSFLPYLEQSKPLLMDIIDALKPGDYLVLQVFGNGSFFLWDGPINSNDDKIAIKKMIKSIQASPDGGTYTVEAMKKFLNKFNRAPEQSAMIKVILLLTDGYVQAADGDFQNIQGENFKGFDRKTTLYVLYLANDHDVDLLRILNREKISFHSSDPSASPATLKWIEQIVATWDLKLLPHQAAQEISKVKRKEASVSTHSPLPAVKKTPAKEEKIKKPLILLVARPGLEGFFSTSTIIALISICALLILLAYSIIHRKAMEKVVLNDAVQEPEEDKVLNLSLLDEMGNKSLLYSLDVVPDNSVSISNDEGDGDIKIEEDGVILFVEFAVNRNGEVFLSKNGVRTTYPLFLNDEEVRGKAKITGTSRIHLTPTKVIQAEFAWEQEAGGGNQNEIDLILQKFQGGVKV